MRPASTSLLLCLCLLSSPPAAAAEREERYEEIRVLLPDPEARVDLLRDPELEVMGLGDGDIRLLSRPSITDRLIEEGWSVEILHPDLEAFYASRTKAAADLGPWHDYDETVEELIDLHEEYPEITTAPFTIGRTDEGREIWAIQISDRPGVDEGEPEVLIDGLHHAREIMTVELTLFFARYLCEGYSVDPVVTNLVDHRVIVIVPIVNPDGFVYNEVRNPSGGGMWRKNRRVNEGSGCRGVDNNRNYPFQWGGQGSSGDPCSAIYRGPYAASEPETRAIIELAESRRFVTHNSIHSVMGSLLIPWCYTSDPTPDDALLRTIAAAMTAENGYQIGQCPEILYQVSGGSIDWLYGEQGSKPKVFSVSTEVGGSGFWPAYSEREGLLQENLHSLLYLAQVAGPSLGSVEVERIDEGEDGRIDPGETVELVVSVRNDGLVAEARGVSLRLRCDDPYVRLRTASATLPVIPPQGSDRNEAAPLRFDVEEGAPQGREVPFTLEVRAEGAAPFDEPFLWPVGQLEEIAAEDFEASGSSWLPDASDTAEEGQFVRIEPVATPYQPGEDADGPPGTHAWVTGQNEDEANEDVDGGVAATRSPDYDLSGATDVRLSMRYFHGQRDGGDDPEGDWFAIDLSSDGGVSWTNLVRIGDQASAPVWRELSVALSDVIDLTDRVRMRVQASDGPGEGDIIEAGIDAFRLLAAGSRNHRPGPPGIVSPADGATGVPGLATLTVASAADEDGDPLAYGFRIFSDPDLTVVVEEVDGVGEGEGTTSWTVGTHLAVGTYFWRSYADDRQERSLYGPVATFTVTDSSCGEGGSPAGALLVAGPNPSTSFLRLRYLVPASTASTIAIYDPQGRRVRSFPQGTGGSGWRELLWDGRNDAGRAVASGTYWVRLWTPKETRTVRVVRVE